MMTISLVDFSKVRFPLDLHVATRSVIVIFTKLDEDESEEDTEDDGDYGLIDPEAGFDETSAKKKPSRDATVTNGTELTAADTSLNGTKVETTTKKKDDDDDEVSLPTQL